MNLTYRTFLLFNLNAAVDQDEHGQFSKEEMIKAIMERRVPDLLNRVSYMDLSIYRPEHWDEFYQEWQDMANVIDAGRKMGVRQNGICLLIGYLVESIQREARSRGWNSDQTAKAKDM